MYVNYFQLISNFFHPHKFCNTNSSTTVALTHAAFQKPPGTSAGFWLGGQCPLAAWDDKNLENFTMKRCILEYICINTHVCSQQSAVLYTCLPWLLSKYNINREKCSVLHVVAFKFFLHFSRGVSWPHLPLCADAHVSHQSIIRFSVLLLNSASLCQ